MANKAALADQSRTIFHCADEARFAERGYWLTKRRDGRSGNWMIARYQPRNRSIVYKSCGTDDLEIAKRKLIAFANDAPPGVKPPRSRKSEEVYFIRAESGQIKIGVARDVAKRLAALQTMSPVKLEIVARCGGGQPVEFSYHKKFAEHRLHGEWFAPHPDILAEVERLSTPTTGG